MLDQKGIRKAAVFLNGLDWETASLLLKKLPVEESKAIRREMVAAEGISLGEINKTVQSFLQETQYGKTGGAKRDGRVKTVFSDDGVDMFELTGGSRESGNRDNIGPTMSLYTAFADGGNMMPSNVDANGDACENAAKQPEPSNTAEAAAETTEAVEPCRFDYLERMSPFDAACFLAGEGEQLIAVVLSQLTPRYSGDVLACFEQPLRMSLIRRLAKLDATDETIMDEIDAVLKERLRREVEELPKSKPGLALLERILQVVDNELGHEHGGEPGGIGLDIISGLNEIDMEEQQAAYYGQLDACNSESCDDVWSFDDLTLFEDHELETLFRMQDRDIVAKSLAACDELFVARVLGRFPVYEQVTLRRMLYEAAACCPDEQAYARHCVMQGTVQLIEEGRIAEPPVYPDGVYLDSRSTLVDYSV